MTSPPAPDMRTHFFIVGAARSGSTYLYYMLKDHPKVALTNEARIIDALGLGVQAMSLPYGVRHGSTGMMGVLRSDVQPLMRQVFLERLPAMIEAFYERHFDKDFTHCGDKLPDPHTAAMAARENPRVKVIYLARDPRDVVCSFLNLQEKGRAGHDLGPRMEEFMASGVEDFARVWDANNRCLLDNLGEHLLIRYPELIREPRRCVEAVLDHLGLAMVPEVSEAIDRNDTIGGHGTSRNAEASIGRWRRDLDASQQAAILDLCGESMERLGLPFDLPIISPRSERSAPTLEREAEHGM